jgi:hypothetical protein
MKHDALLCISKLKVCLYRTIDIYFHMTNMQNIISKILFEFNREKYKFRSQVCNVDCSLLLRALVIKIFFILCYVKAPPSGTEFFEFSPLICAKMSFCW